MNAINPYAPPFAPTETRTHEPRITFSAFTATGALRAAHATFRERPYALAWLTAASLAMSVGATSVTALVFERLALGQFGTLFSGFIQLLLSTFFTMGSSRLMLAAARGRSVRFSMLLQGGDVLFPGLVAAICISFLTMLGTLALVVPGLVVLVATTFTTLVIADRRVDGVTAIRESFRLTRGHRWQLLLLVGLQILVLIGGTLLLGIGLLAAYPIVLLSTAHAYVALADES